MNTSRAVRFQRNIKNANQSVHFMVYYIEKIVDAVSTPEVSAFMDVYKNGQFAQKIGPFIANSVDGARERLLPVMNQYWHYANKLKTEEEELNNQQQGHSPTRPGVA